MKYLRTLAVIASLAFVVSACNLTISSNNPSATVTPSTGQTHFGVQTKTSGCGAQGGLPRSDTAAGPQRDSGAINKI